MWDASRHATTRRWPKVATVEEGSLRKIRMYQKYFLRVKCFLKIQYEEIMQLTRIMNSFQHEENSVEFKAVLNCPLTEAKLSYVLLKLIF